MSNTVLVFVSDILFAAINDTFDRDDAGGITACGSKVCEVREVQVFFR